MWHVPLWEFLPVPSKSPAGTHSRQYVRLVRTPWALTQGGCVSHVEVGWDQLANTRPFMLDMRIVGRLWPGCTALTARRTLVPVAARFYQLVVDANDPSRLAHWWAEVLGYDVLYETADEVIIGTDPAGIRESVSSQAVMPR